MDKSDGAIGKRDAKNDAMIRKLRDEPSESQLQDSCGKWFRPCGSFSLALKRTVGGLAACKMGLATCQDVSVHTVLAWEHKLAATLLAQYRDFYRCHLHQIVTVEPDFFFSTEEVGNHCVSCRRHEQEDMGR